MLGVLRSLCLFCGTRKRQHALWHGLIDGSIAELDAHRRQLEAASRGLGEAGAELKAVATSRLVVKQEGPAFPFPERTSHANVPVLSVGET